MRSLNVIKIAVHSIVTMLTMVVCSVTLSSHANTHTHTICRIHAILLWCNRKIKIIHIKVTDRKLPVGLFFSPSTEQLIMLNGFSVVFIVYSNENYLTKFISLRVTSLLSLLSLSPSSLSLWVSVQRANVHGMHAAHNGETPEITGYKRHRKRKRSLNPGNAMKKCSILIRRWSDCMLHGNPLWKREKKSFANKRQAENKSH